MTTHTPRITPPPGPRPAAPLTPVMTKLEKWCTDFCSAGKSTGVVTGMRQLGPVVNFTDLLVAANSASPQKIVAAEQLIHMVEGWRYAAASITAFLSNSHGAATHFAYYAELRAAMSLFASSGLRVKQGDYFYLDATGQKVSATSERTHTAVWGLWSRWVERNDAQNLFLEKIRLSPKITLRNIVTELTYVNTTAPLKKWGADLVNISLDHEARNVSSYDAYWTEKPLTLMAKSEPELVKEIWQLFLNDGTGLVFDSALIAKFVDDALGTMTQPPNSVASARTALAQRIGNKTGIDPTSIDRRLSGAYPSRPFALAVSSSTGAENVLVRAFFLLRMSMLAAKTGLQAAGNKSASTWIENWLIHAGLWSPSWNIGLADLEEDYRVAVSAFKCEAPLPNSLWEGENGEHSIRLMRPEACIAWGLQ
jgi:hypothetical protein